MSFLASPLFVTCSIAAIISWIAYWRKSRLRHLPPGPKGWPFIGSVLDMPKTFEWERYREWCRKYDSDIIYFQALGQNIIVIDKYETAIELLEKRSGIYSSRQKMPMMEMMGGWDELQFAFSPYGDRWRRKRRLSHQVLNEGLTSGYYPLVQKSACRLVLSLIQEGYGEEHMHLAHMISASTVVELTYGLPAESTVNDPRCMRFEAVVNEVVQAIAPGAYLVNVIPILKHIPSWFPGGGFKSYAKMWAERSKEVAEGTYEEAKETIRRANTTSSPAKVSFIRDCLDGDSEHDTPKEEEDIISSVALSIYAAGVETSSAAIQILILVLLLNPSVQKDAQEELSRVTQPGHLPSYMERENYPYMNALMMEVLRWGSIVPFAVPHMVEGDDIYRGYFIPGGSTIIPNAWSMLHDETIYPNPNVFNPSRFLNSHGQLDTKIRNPYEVVFGFGRRVCPGKHLALMSFWTNAAYILSTFDILPVSEGEGEIVTGELVSGLVLHPKSFKCHFKLRSKEAERVIQEMFESVGDT